MLNPTQSFFPNEPQIPNRIWAIGCTICLPENGETLMTESETTKRHSQIEPRINAHAHESSTLLIEKLVASAFNRD